MNILFLVILLYLNVQVYKSTPTFYKRVLRTGFIFTTGTTAWLYFAVPQLPTSVQFINLNATHEWVAMNVDKLFDQQDALKEQIVNDFTKSVDVNNRTNHAAADTAENNDAKTTLMRKFTGVWKTK